jgi:hemerythrin superfamily protein
MPQAHHGNHAFGRLATGAAFGLVAGLALPHARKAVMQGPSLAAGDWMDALKAEHRMVEKSMEALLKTGEHEAAKRELLLTKIAYALTKHAIEEENVIYPALAEGGHADAAKQLIEDHGQVKTCIYDLRRLSSKDPAWIGEARKLSAALHAHVHEEENSLFPTFRQEIGQDENMRLTRMMNWEGFKVA